MLDNNLSYRDKKVMTMKIVTDMTGLSERKIRYYEARELIFPERSSSGFRKYSFSDIERLMDIAEKIEDGVQTKEIRQDFLKDEKRKKDTNVRKGMIRGQLNAHFPKARLK
ncbi:MerR family transcriptional regulator [Priestia megaterium]|uniref:MerR family transcriptional regulator n=1 Tax=Priestia megaterium TaxID=1404 RepID=UPI002A6B8C0A|nr:MerR family transcriptional regulator [Priestia megaterium]MDY0944344.1 MerR family transcriptional regulator [Priestia megaterium]